MRVREDMLKENERRNRNVIVLIFRYLGFNLALKLKGTRVTPNQVTVISLIFGILAAFSLCVGTYLYFILGALFYQISVVLDYCDGSLARLKGMSSYSGKWLEQNNDTLREFLVIFSICWGLYRQTSNVVVWILGFILCGASFMSDILSLMFKSFPFAGQGVSSFVSKSKLYRIGKHFINSRALRYFTIIFFAIANRMFIFLVLFSCYDVLLFLAMAFSLGKIVRKNDKLKTVHNKGGV